VEVAAAKEAEDKVVVAVAVVDRVVRVAEAKVAVVDVAVRVVLAAALDQRDVLESGTSAVRGSQVKMAGLPRLTVRRAVFLSHPCQQASSC
jgi:hypothetical protein